MILVQLEETAERILKYMLLVYLAETAVRTLRYKLPVQREERAESTLGLGFWYIWRKQLRGL